MTLDKQVAGLLKKYADYDYNGSIPLDVFKDLVRKINLYPLSVNKIIKAVKTNGYIVVYEPLLVYNKEDKHARLTMKPRKSDQIITKLSFSPASYNSLLMACDIEGFLTSGAVSTYEHSNYTAYNNFLFITIDFETLKAVKKKYMEIL